MQRQRNARRPQTSGKPGQGSPAPRRAFAGIQTSRLGASQGRKLLLNVLDPAEVPLRDKLREARSRARRIHADQRGSAPGHRHVFTPSPPFDIGKFEYIDGVQSIHAQTRLAPQVFQLWRRMGEMEVIYGQPLEDIGPAPALLVIHKRDAQNLARSGISVRLAALKKSNLDPELFCRLIDLSDELRFKDTLNELVHFKGTSLPKALRRLRPALQN